MDVTVSSLPNMNCCSDYSREHHVDRGCQIRVSVASLQVFDLLLTCHRCPLKNRMGIRWLADERENPLLSKKTLLAQEQVVRVMATCLVTYS